ncbi:zinc finger, SWIM-type protein [Rhodotorula toruloides]|uniref:Zinc finger, SWIM-type protein n=1 Tax=Rhodotorula toruloides TaxID=5286 RepID=A0A511KCF4_RHOTO|nr:zinc finger, SWIM-type protein [Rhodotorula toruloides]
MGTEDTAVYSLEQLLNGHIAWLEPPFSDDDLRTLALLVGPSTLLNALDLVDRDQVARITPPNGRRLYQVASSSGGLAYTVFPEIVGGYCPCPAFSNGVIARQSQGNPVICKHLLACRLADRLGSSGWKDKHVSLKWVAGLATKFGTAGPPGLSTTPAPTPAGDGAVAAG